MRLAYWVAASAAVFVQPAYAAQYAVNIVATNFGPLLPSTIGVTPIDPVTFDSIVDFDPSNDVAATTTGLTINAFNLPYATQFAYNSATDTLIFGTTIDASFSIPSAPSSWFVAIGSALSGNPFSYNFVQMSPEQNDGSHYDFSSKSVSISIRNLNATSPVPEPSAWAMLITGFGLMGFALRSNGSATRIRFS